MATHPYVTRRVQAFVLRAFVPLAAWAGFCACQRTEPKPPAAPAAVPTAPAASSPAYLEALHGTVQVRPQGAATASPGSEKQALAVDDVVETGHDGETDVVFAGNNRVHLGPDSSLWVHGAGATATQVGAILMRGAARAEGGGEGVGLSIGTPLGTARMLGQKLTVLELDLGSGLKLTTGEVDLLRPDRLEVQPLTLGQTLAIDALPVLLPGQQLVDVPGLTVQSAAPTPPAMVAHLSRREGRPLRRAADGTAWTATAQGDELRAGDRLRLGANDHAEVNLAEGMDVAMHGNGELRLGQVARTSEGLRAQYALRRGNAQLRISGTGGDKDRPAQEVSVAGATVQVAPGAREARVEVQNARPRSARVLVRYGRVRVGNVELEAGQAVDVASGVVSAVQPAFAEPLQLAPGKPAVLWAQREVPPVRFGAPVAGSHHVEVADAPDMAKLRSAEDTRQGALASDEVPLGTTYWRNGEAPAAKLEVRREPPRGCRQCAREEAIDDSGGASEVMYQSEPPALVLRWSEVPEAQGYKVQMVQAERPATETLTRTTDKTQLRLEPGTLVHGTYQWTVTPLDGAGAPLAAPKANKLRLTLDNVVRGLRVRYPDAAVRLRRRALTTYGEVQRGSRLRINGSDVPLDSAGAFRVKLSLHPGLNRLVYQVARDGEPEHIYVRNVVRLAKGRPARARAAADGSTP